MLKLIIDTREKLPLEFKGGVFDVIEKGCLNVGDYACEFNGEPLPLVFERKGFGDLFGTMTHGYERFKKEMMRAKQSKKTMILLIEGSLTSVANGYEHSQFSGSSMRMKLSTLRVKYDLEYHFCNNRVEMSRWIEDLFGAISRTHKKEKKDHVDLSTGDKNDITTTKDIHGVADRSEVERNGLAEKPSNNRSSK